MAPNDNTLIVSIELGVFLLKIREGEGGAASGEGEGGNEFCVRMRKFGQRQTEILKQHDQIVKMRRKMQDNFIF